MLTPLSLSEPDCTSTVPDPEIGMAPPMPPPPKFITRAPLSTTALPPPTRKAELPSPHCIVAPESIVTLPPMPLAPVMTVVPLTASAEPLPEMAFAEVTGPAPA